MQVAVYEPDDWMETFAVVDVERADAVALKESVTAWLVERDVIEAAEWRNILEPLGHGLGPNGSSLHEPVEGKPQIGLVSIVASGEGIIVCGKAGPVRAHCPHCRAQQGFTAATLDTWEKDAENACACITCRRTSALELWDGGREFAFTRLAVVFNHWPPVVKSFKQELSDFLGGRDVRVIRGRF